MTKASYYSYLGTAMTGLKYDQNCILNYTSYGSRSFAVSGPRVWNDLPPTLHSSSITLGHEQSRLKTTLFRLAYGM